MTGLPRRITRRRLAGLALVLAVLVTGIGLLGSRSAGWSDRSDEPIGLFTSLPILWGEQADLRDLLAAHAPHWARGALEANGRLVVLDTLLNLATVDRLVLAQPRPLSPDENVALDNWVRGGGRLLLFADPMLTEESAFSLGDRRRPQDVVLLSPILARWGLGLGFDDAQPGGLRENAGEGLAVDLPGQLEPLAGGTDAYCRIGAEALIARCRAGKGRVTVVADAALLGSGGDLDRKMRQFDILLTDAFAR